MVKSIIKRIIVGVGISLCLMALKHGGLIASVNALSCDVSRKNFVHPLESWHGNILNTSHENNMSVSFYDRNTFTNGEQRVYFDDNDSYIDVLVSLTWTMAFQSNTISNENNDNKDYQFHIQSSPPIVYLLDDTDNPNNWVWTQGVWDNGFYRVRFFKSNYNTNYINLKQLKIGLPTWWYNFIVSAFVDVNGYFQVEHFQCDSNKALKEAFDENTKAIEKTNDTIKDDSVDNSKASNTIDSIKNKLANNGSITQLLTLPITLYQSILNSLNGSCSPISLGTLYNHNLDFPCINLQELLGSTLYNIIDILCCGLFILSIRKKMVDIFNHMSSLNDRGNELE